MVSNIMKIDIDIECAKVFLPFLEPARYKVAEGGRGGAKSWFFARQGVLKVLTEGKLMLCCRETQTSIKQSVKALLEKQMIRMGVLDHFEITNQEIRCKNNNGKIVFGGLRSNGANASAAENLKSYEGVDICWVEEAQTISKFSLDILLPTIRKPGSEIWFSYNRKNEKEPVHTKFVENETIPEGTVHVNVNYWDNPWFPQELRLLMESDKANSMDDYNHIWCGLPQVRSKATIFTKWKIASCTPSDDSQSYIGLDFGFFPDPCSIVRAWVDWRIKRIYIDHAYYAVKLDPDQIGPDLVDKIPGSKRAKIFADNARPEIIAKLNKGGYSVIGAQKGPGSIELGIEWLQSWEIWIHPRCEEIDDSEYPDYNMAEELRNYKRKTDRFSGDVLPVVLDKFNHGIDALRYGLSELIRSSGGIDYIKMMSDKRSVNSFNEQAAIAANQESQRLRIPKTKAKVKKEDVNKDNKGSDDGFLYVNAKDLGLKL